MKALNFEEVVDLINKSRTTEIDIIPITADKGKWALFKGINKVPNFSYPFNILYLYSDFTKEAINKAIQSITYPNATQIVYAQSVKQNYIEELKLTLKRGRKELAGILDLKTYLSSFIQDQMRSYIDKLKELKPPIFIQPYFETPSGAHRKFPNPLDLFFSDNTEDVKDGALAVLLAEPGQGKTYTARHLTNILIEKDFIPIYIQSSQWSTMQEGDLSSIYKTIIHSFRYNNASIDWIEGEEEKFIKVTLKVGIFRIIFDGFDEYILWNNGNVSADDTIKSLHDLVQNSGARVLVTSRTTFWNSTITSDESLLSLFKYSILPFDLNHAKDYFTKRFVDKPKSIDKAISVFSKIRGTGKSDIKSSFAGRGIILNLIADLCSDNIDVSTYDDSISVWQWIISALCQREEERQKLNGESLKLNAEKQLSILKLFVEEKAKGLIPNTLLLSDIISLHYEEKNEDEIKSILLSLLGDNSNRGKLADHPLITKDDNTGLWLFKHEQIEFNLIAELIIDYAKSNNINSLNSFFNDLVVKGSILDDLTIVLIEQIDILLEKNPQLSLNSLLYNFKECRPQENDRQRKFSNISIVLTKIIYSYLNKFFPVGSTDKETRFKELLNLIGASRITGYHFTGAIASIDFSGVVFNNCVFENTVWTNCRFNQATVFNGCFFIGGEVHNCENFGSAIFKKNCELDKFAEISINYEKIRFGTKKVDNEDIKQDIALFVKKFVPRDGSFKSVYDDGLLKGHLAISPYKNELVSIMKKFVVDENIDESGHYYKIKPEAKESINHFLNNGIFSGALAQTYNELLRRLKND